MVTEKEKKVLRFVQSSGITDSIEQIFRNVFITMLDDSNEQTIDDFLNKLNEKLEFDKLVELFVPTYAKYLPDEHIDRLIAMIESPEYQEFLKNLTLILKETTEISSVWINNRSEAIEKLAEEFDI